MRLRRIMVAACAGAVLATLGAAPASAGAWAVTVLDPPATQIQSGQPQRLGFWVLQHGTHPFNWPNDELGDVGLALVDGGGEVVTFPGIPLAEPAHFTATVTVPHDGAWRVIGIQGQFLPYEVGTLQVPGTVKAFAAPAAPNPADIARYWPGAVRPPVLPVDQTRDPFANVPDVGSIAAPAANVPAAPQAADPRVAKPAGGADPAVSDPGPPSRTVPPVAFWAAVAVVLAGVGAFAVARRRPRARPEPLPTLERTEV